MKKIAIILITLALGLTGCSRTTAYSEPVPEPVPVPVSDNIPGDNMVLDSSVEARLINSNWISPAEVNIGNLYPGASATWRMRVHNGGDLPATFAVYYRVPDDTRDGYDKAPLEAQDWVIIADATPIISPKGTAEVSVSVSIPKGVEVSSKQWEFWVAVCEKGQGFIQTETASRWFVRMR